MRPRRNRGNSIKANRMRKFVILRMHHEKIDSNGNYYYDGEYYPVIVKRGSFDPRTRCADPSATDWRAIKKILHIPQSEYVDVLGVIESVESGVLDMEIQEATLAWYWPYIGYSCDALYAIIYKYDLETAYDDALSGDGEDFPVMEKKLEEWFSNHTTSYYTGDYYGFR